MMTISKMALFASGVSSLLAFGAPVLANANDYSRRQAARHEIRGDLREIRRDRAELRRDRTELVRDRADLRQLYRSGASRGEIHSKKQEVRSGAREVAQGRRELRRDYAELRRDRGRFGFGDSGRFDNRDRWHRYDNGRRNWGRDRFDGQNRWGWGNGRR
ncbi:MAG TPA: hypothetical protein VEB61_07200 [Candidatus Binatia bacterium]|nr:hypothetical protein [Candidatus Binatia bacterium]